VEPVEQPLDQIAQVPHTSDATYLDRYNVATAENVEPEWGLQEQYDIVRYTDPALFRTDDEIAFMTEHGTTAADRIGFRYSDHMDEATVDAVIRQLLEIDDLQLESVEYNVMLDVQ
jgi:hypothetical protein